MYFPIFILFKIAQISLVIALLTISTYFFLNFFVFFINQFRNSITIKKNSRHSVSVEKGNVSSFCWGRKYNILENITFCERRVVSY